MPGSTEFRRLKHPPLVHVVAQVLFAPALDIANYMAEVQTKLRPLGFGRLQVAEAQQITVHEGLSAKVESKPRWDFLNHDATMSIVVSTDFVALQTSNYEHFGVFSGILENTLKVIAGATPFASLARVGLRYVNLIRPSNLDRKSAHLRPELLAFPFGAMQAQLTSVPQFATHAVASTAVGTLVVRTYQLAPKQMVPPDLASPTLKYPPHWADQTGAVALDIDHFAQSEIEFTPQVVLGIVSGLHDLIKIAFSAAITEHALTDWGPEELVNAG